MCSVQLDELHDKSAATQTPSGRQRGCSSVLPSISAILGQQQLPNATMSRVDSLIYTGTKFPAKILLPSHSLTQLGISTVLPYLLQRERKNIRAFQCLISPAGGWCEDQKGASMLLTDFKVCACICSLFYILQLKCSLIGFCFFTLIELTHIGYSDIFIFISKLCATFHAGYIASPCIYFLWWQADLFPCKQWNCLLFRQNKNILFGIIL